MCDDRFDAYGCRSHAPRCDVAFVYGCTLMFKRCCETAHGLTCTGEQARRLRRLRARARARGGRRRPGGAARPLPAGGVPSWRPSGSESLRALDSDSRSKAGGSVVLSAAQRSRGLPVGMGFCGSCNPPHHPLPSATSPSLTLPKPPRKHLHLLATFKVHIFCRAPMDPHEARSLRIDL